MDNVKIVGLGKKRYTGRPECAQERDLEGAAHPGPWPGSVEAASRQGKRAGWICEGRLVLGLGQLMKRRRPKGAEARSTAGERILSARCRESRGRRRSIWSRRSRGRRGGTWGRVHSGEGLGAGRRSLTDPATGHRFPATARRTGARGGIHGSRRTL